MKTPENPVDKKKLAKFVDRINREALLNEFDKATVLHQKLSKQQKQRRTTR